MSDSVDLYQELDHLRRFGVRALKHGEDTLLAQEVNVNTSVCLISVQWDSTRAVMMVIPYRALFQILTMVDRASPANSGIIVHKNMSRTHGSKKRVSIPCKNVALITYGSENTTKKDVEISAVADRNSVPNQFVHQWPHTEFQGSSKSVIIGNLSIS
ncbi:hypothetical protein AVEN_33112-1 [Araneus ventricosus]|uniref:Uncharacterized protein n=1 Tax=Araneus ventricosus TaxID=182803 RepID=A0A4Y2CTY9_ARAVE|nr:hypothetical protein AVEN_33112-1 [Araneus ventricosus]